MREEGEEEEDVMDMGTITIGEEEEEEEEEGILIAEAAMNTSSPATTHTKPDWAFVEGVTG